MYICIHRNGHRMQFRSIRIDEVKITVCSETREDESANNLNETRCVDERRWENAWKKEKKIYIYICKKRSDERKKNLINSMTCAKAIEKIIEFTLFLFFFTFHCDYLYVLVLYYYYYNSIPPSFIQSFIQNLLIF